MCGLGTGTGERKREPPADLETSSLELTSVISYRSLSDWLGGRKEFGCWN